MFFFFRQIASQFKLAWREGHPEFSQVTGDVQLYLRQLEQAKVHLFWFFPSTFHTIFAFLFFLYLCCFYIIHFITHGLNQNDFLSHDITTLCQTKLLLPYRHTIYSHFTLTQMSQATCVAGLVQSTDADL